MLLSYRGFHYQASTALLPEQQDLTTAKYRGVSYNIVKHITIKTPSKSQLKYRGFTYIH